MSAARGPITTHVLDLARGRPADGIAVRLDRLEGGMFQEAGRGVTDADGRIADLLPPGPVAPGVWRLVFETGPYQARHGGGFYPEVPVVFEVSAGREHYHVPLLLSPFGYSTYRGS